MKRLACLCITCILTAACSERIDSHDPHTAEEPAASPRSVKVLISGQALIKVDPRTIWPAPYAGVQPIVKSADLGFTNFEMAVNPPGNGCGVPDDYVTITGELAIEHLQRPGNTSGPHAVSEDVMEFLSGMNFRLMSLANNHAWDLGECGVIATIDAADKYGIVHAGTGRAAEDAASPAYLTIKDTRIALVAATTSRDERDLLLGNVNGVWTGHQEDRDRNIAAVRGAASNADFVIYYQHYQIHDEDFEGLEDGQQTEDGHFYIDSVDAWQESFAKAVIDAGASIYIGHGHRGFDGVEIYKGRPIFRQFGGLAYHAMRDIGGYPGEYAFWGLLGMLTIEEGDVVRMEFIPLSLNEGQDLVDEYDRRGFLTRRGAPEIATGEMAAQILGRFQRLSADHGTSVVIQDERGIVEVADTFRDCAACPQMTWIPAGQFVMGSPADDPDRDEDEAPQHHVEISDRVAVGIYEVSWDQWDACVSDGGCAAVVLDDFPIDEGWGKWDRPVINVSWRDAQSYVVWLRELTGMPYRLMSEAEWEYVARAGSGSRYPFGDDEQDLCIYANGADLATDFNNRNTCFDGIGRETAPVGSYEANAFGLHDMLGNVWEWTNDCWNRSYEGAPADGTAWGTGDCSQRILRGGSWGSYPHNLRSATRYGIDAAYRGHEVGFRVARGPTEPGQD